MITFVYCDYKLYNAFSLLLSNSYKSCGRLFSRLHVQIYSIFLFFQDREPKIHAGHHRNSIDEEFSGRIKSIEDKLKGSTPVEKKPRDLLRAIGLYLYSLVFLFFIVQWVLCRHNYFS